MQSSLRMEQVERVFGPESAALPNHYSNEEEDRTFVHKGNLPVYASKDVEMQGTRMVGIFKKGSPSLCYKAVGEDGRVLEREAAVAVPGELINAHMDASLQGKLAIFALGPDVPAVYPPDPDDSPSLPPRPTDTASKIWVVDADPPSRKADADILTHAAYFLHPPTHPATIARRLTPICAAKKGGSSVPSSSKNQDLLILGAVVDEVKSIKLKMERMEEALRRAADGAQREAKDRRTLDRVALLFEALDASLQH